MATVDRWLLPDGIEEVLPPEAARVEAARRQVLDLFQRWGYEFVVTPHIEYLESLLTGAGQDLDLRTFKVTDPASGRLMGFRADITPQVARMDAHSLRREGPNRLCYAGSVLHARPRALATSRSPIQLGAELYGNTGSAGDVEVISLLLDMLEMAQVPDVHMDLGHVGIYRGLAQAAGLSGEVEQLLFDALQRKAVDEIAALTEGLPGDLAGMLRALAELCGGREVLSQAREVLAGAPAPVQTALADITAIADSLAARFPQLPLYFDLGELRGYHYHTGVVFAAFVPGVGESIAQGGRYDDIGADLAVPVRRPVFPPTSRPWSLSAAPSSTSRAPESGRRPMASACGRRCSSCAVRACAWYRRCPGRMRLRLPKRAATGNCWFAMAIGRWPRSEARHSSFCRPRPAPNIHDGDKFMGKNVVVLGTQWGDEGKGKIVDLLTDQAAAWCVTRAATMPVIPWWSLARRLCCT